MSDEDDDVSTANTLDDGDSVEVQGSSSTYTLSRNGNVYMCSCPAWKNQGAAIDARTCKHLRAYLGEDAEVKRLGALPSRAASTRSSGGGGGRAAATAKETAPPILLAHKWETDQDPTSWWMSEKLDGVRAYWDGEAFVSRLGNRFFAPDWFTADLPADTLDGELWVDRKKFSRTISIVRSGAAGAEWKEVRYVVFDAPNAKGGFEERIAHVKKVLARAGAPHAHALEHVQCEGFDHLKEELARVEALGGEGLMLRRPGSKYEIGRSQSLLKVKTFHDTEARVIGHAPGTGKHKGRLGALVCALPNGVTFNVGTGFSDAERENPPKIGAVITFRYQELTDDGVPRFPSYVGERIDVELPTAAPAVPKPAASAKAAKAPKPRAAPAPEPVAEIDEAAPAEAALDDTATDESAPDYRKGAPEFAVKLVHDEENKFWEIEVRGGTHLTKFGKIGSPGQTRISEIGSATAARTDAAKRAMQKRREGYRNVRP